MAEMDDSHRSGSCLCGRVQFQITLPSKWCGHCHCTLCRRAHTAAFVTWFGMDADRFQIMAGADDLRRFASSAGARRSFCGVCGSTLLFEGDRWPGEVHVALASLDGKLDREPAANVYWDRHVPWIHHLNELPRLGGETGTDPLAEGG